MCHRLDLRSRLHIAGPALNPADLLLTKLQIVELNRKDAIDMIALLLAHPLGADGIDAAYIASMVADDWGLFYTCSLNLERAAEILRDIPLMEADRDRVREQIARIQEQAECVGKSLRWRLRAKIGPRRKWYQTVSEGTDAF